MYNNRVKFEWIPQKNELLKDQRNISFETIIFHLSNGDVWKTADHPDQQKYPGQKLYFVIVEDYIYIVPFMTEKETFFLKTIIPSRKATRMYEAEKGSKK